jgi:hypothetical protein
MVGHVVYSPLLLLPELLESSLGVFVGPARLVLSTLVMAALYGAGTTQQHNVHHSRVALASLRVGS